MSEKMISIVAGLQFDQDREDVAEAILLEICEEMAGDTMRFVQGMFWTAALEFIRTLFDKCGQSSVKKHLARAKSRSGYRRRLVNRMNRRFGEEQVFNDEPDFARAAVEVGIEIDADEWAALAN